MSLSRAFTLFSCYRETNDKKAIILFAIYLVYERNVSSGFLVVIIQLLTNVITFPIVQKYDRPRTLTYRKFRNVLRKNISVNNRLNMCIVPACIEIL